MQVVLKVVLSDPLRKTSCFPILFVVLFCVFNTIQSPGAVDAQLIHLEMALNVANARFMQVFLKMCRLQHDKCVSLWLYID